MKILLFFILTLFALTAWGQDYLLDKYEDTYFHQRKEYNWKELGDVYLECEEAHGIYTYGRNYLNLSNKYAKGGAISMGAGAIIMLIGAGDSRVAYGEVLIVAGVLIELGALIYLVNGKAKLLRAENVFNFEMMKRFGYKEDISLTLGATMNGAGLVLKF